MIYFYADLVYKGKVFRLLKPVDNSSDAINEILKRQGDIQASVPEVITLFGFRGSYMHTAHSQAHKDFIIGFLNKGNIPPYSTIVWAQSFLA
jgi:hypothetical protein